MSVTHETIFLKQSQKALELVSVQRTSHPYWHQSPCEDLLAFFAQILNQPKRNDKRDLHNPAFCSVNFWVPCLSQNWSLCHLMIYVCHQPYVLHTYIKGKLRLFLNAVKSCLSMNINVHLSAELTSKAQNVLKCKPRFSTSVTVLYFLFFFCFFCS